MKKINKRGTILIENVIFIILTILFFSVALFAIYMKSEPDSKLAERKAKQLALMIDSARPGTSIWLDFSDVFQRAEANKISVPVSVDNEKNIVRARLSEKAAYEYSFFNEIQVKIISDNSHPNQLGLELS